MRPAPLDYVGLVDVASAMDWAEGYKNAVLITIRRDGRPQSSDITYARDGDSFLVSLTSDRAKTINMRRDPRVVLHVTDPSTWSYVSFDSTVSLSPTAAAVDDATVEELVSYYRSVTNNEHDDWDEYRQAMVNDGRLIARITPSNAVGQVH